MIESAFVTLCFYQHPQALPHIEQWETTLKDKIIYSKHHNYLVKRNETSVEYLPCIPIGDNLVVGVQVFADAQMMIQDFYGDMAKKISYFKTLIFGQVSIRQLNRIITIMEYFEGIQNG